MKVKRLLVPTDFSSASLAALEYAAEFADSGSTDLVLLHVMDPILYTPTHYAYASIDPGTILKEQERGTRTQLERLERQWRMRLPRLRTVLMTGTPSATIVAAAKKLKTDIIVIATHGHTGLKHLLLGSVAERVVRTASCPVLTVRSGSGVSARRRQRRAIKRGTRAA